MKEIQTSKGGTLSLEEIQNPYKIPENVFFKTKPKTYRISHQTSMELKSPETQTETQLENQNEWDKWETDYKTYENKNLKEENN